MHHVNKLHDNSVADTTDVAKGIIEYRVWIHSDCASLVVVSSGMVLPSEYEGQVSR